MVRGAGAGVATIRATAAMAERGDVAWAWCWSRRHRLPIVVSRMRSGMDFLFDKCLIEQIEENCRRKSTRGLLWRPPN